jgi:integrase/recombinase XerC
MSKRSALQVVAPKVVYFDSAAEAAALFDSIMAGFDRHRFSRGFDPDTIANENLAVRRLASWTATHYGTAGPWEWERHMGEAWIGELRVGADARALGTVRSYQGAVRRFMEYLTNPDYPWLGEVQRAFGRTPAQIFDEFNSIRHSRDESAKTTERYPISRQTLQQIFDYLDDRVEKTKGKSIVPAARDSALFKCYYAFGLRRDELRMADLPDLSFNPYLPQYGRIGGMLIRFGKGTRRSGPRTRLVRTVPLFDWIVEVLEQYLVDVRPRLVAKRPSVAFFPSERGGRFSQNHVDDRWADVRHELGLDENMKLHCLRHSYMTHLLEAGYPAKFVQMQAGHIHMGSMATYTNKIGDEFCNAVLRNAHAAAFAPRSPEEALRLLKRVDSDVEVDD